MEYNHLLSKVNKIKNKHFTGVLLLINNLNDILKEYCNKQEYNPFNILLATSELYYYENYHSDIIAYILENDNKAINYFINYINILSSNSKINNEYYDYNDLEIYREENKIDILIRNNINNHCIIFENKINNAGDMNRQLPRYYLSQKKKSYTIDKIIYFSIDGKKTPDKTSWTKKDRLLGLENIIVLMPASTGDTNDFVSSFLNLCRDNSLNDNEKRSFYEQYINLLKYLRRNQMDYQLMEKFYLEMLNKEQYNSALSIKDMLNELITFRRDRLYNTFANDHAPFDKTFKYSSNDTVYNYIYDITQENLKLDIFSEDNSTRLMFWIQDTNIKKDLIYTILETIGEQNNFIKESKNCYYKLFKFPEDDKQLYEYIKTFFKLLNKYKDKIK